MASTEEKEGAKEEEVVSLELPAPPGWKKKFYLKQGATPKKNDIIFTSPTGEEFNNKRHLEQYLKAHPGSPAASKFDWGTGETLRRSARISEKAKLATTLEKKEPPKKRRRSSLSAKVVAKETDTAHESSETKEAQNQETYKDSEGGHGQKIDTPSYHAEEHEKNNEKTVVSEVNLNDNKNSEGEKVEKPRDEHDEGKQDGRLEEKDKTNTAVSDQKEELNKIASAEEHNERNKTVEEVIDKGKT